jgi:hypothetical protein
MSWLDQGRQQHGWFGHGTAQEAEDDGTEDDDATDSDLFGPDGLRQRISAVAYGAVAALPSALRARAAAPSAAGNLSRLTEVMPAWIGGDRLDQARFAGLFFGRAPDDPVVTELRGAVTGAETARSHADLRDAAGHLAQAMQTIGLDRWPRFLADAQERARDAAPIAAVATSPSPPDYAKDAIRPVYPLETLLGVVAGGIAGGVAGAARVAGRAILRQIMPGKPSDGLVLPELAEPKRPITTEVLPGHQGKHIVGSPNYDPTRSTLTADPKALLERFSGRGTQVGRIPVGKPGSREVFDAGNETIGIWRNEDGLSAPTSRGTIHYAKRGAHIVPATPRNWKP